MQTYTVPVLSFFPLNIEQRRRGMQDDVGKSEQGDCEIVQSCA